MRKIIWSCWLQGRANAPELVRRCLASWEARNPGWDFRCLDAHSVVRYASLDRYIDLTRQEITAASLSDLIRMLLLHEYGGVWVDATLYCNQPLDEWLPAAAGTGFFSFCNPGPDRPLATWFLACAPGNTLLAKWAARSFHYWKGRARSTDYFWVHHQFGELCALDPDARRAWEAVPKISADGPHSLQTSGQMYAPFSGFSGNIDWTSPVFKLTHRMDERECLPGCVLHHVLHQVGVRADTREAAAPESRPPMRFAGLKVGTENLGDHIQIIAANRLLKRLGIVPDVLLDRDDEIASARALEAVPRPVGILLNGWHKTNPAEWPPHPKLDPIYYSFHIRLFQSPTLLAPPALAHYRKHGPIGCRDRHTAGALRAHGVEAFVSHCVSLLYERRLPAPELQTETYIISRDRRILEFVADLPGPAEFICQYSGSNDFAENLRLACELLERYRTRARLIVTTQLHCALPAIAMGIPVVVFYPPNTGAQHASDRERFSSLEQIVPVFHLARAREVDWNGYRPDVSSLKLSLLDRFYQLAEKWRLPAAPRLGPIAPPEALPVPSEARMKESLTDSERLQALREAKAPDRLRWGNPQSYQPDWAQRSHMAAGLVADHASVLEIGIGTGAFRSLVKDRCRYLGTDLNPLDTETLALDVDRDPLPAGHFDYAVALGVFEYLHWPEAAARKLSAAAEHVVVSYCCRRGPRSATVDADRDQRGWVNAFDESEFVSLFAAAGKRQVSRTPFNATDYFEQVIFRFSA